MNKLYRGFAKMSKPGLLGGTMSTRGVIAFALSSNPDKWEGRYHHSDSYPTGLGRCLFQLYHNTFNRDIRAMHKYLYKDHPAGWSTIQGGDFSLPPGYVEDYKKFYEQDAEGNSDYNRPIPHGPRCFCHGDRHETADRRTETQDTSDLQWGYVLTDRVNTVTMRVLMAVRTKRKDDTEWKQVADIDLAEAEPDWDMVECGEQFERCGHVAEKHFPELTGTAMARLGTDTFLGREKLTLDNAYAVEIDGHRYKLTHSGSAATNSRGNNVWISTVKPDETDPGATVSAVPHRYREFRSYWGTRDTTVGEDGSFWVITRLRTGKGERPYRGVKHLYPPTMKEPARLLAELVRTLAPAPGQTTEDLLTHSRLSRVMARGRHFRRE